MITVEPIQLLQYVRLIFEKTLELKLDAEQELSIKAENECNDYEALLQKLEAEVRQHIRVTVTFSTNMLKFFRLNNN